MTDTPLRAPHGDVPRAEFEAATQRALAWIGDYLEHPERVPVLSRVAAGATRAALPAAPPDTGEPLDRILDDFERTIVPHLAHPLPPSVLPEMRDDAAFVAALSAGESLLRLPS